ncbi:amino acid racemase [Mariniphaga sediminis]|uniref:Amino acid racemase n=1 Tax=Mariniphaga sediminis TaxID=1628158 RepID=A0A399CYD6_9BACT|nr:amino acid racemase [Mariniphaga sediminis]RIH64226.1 amino acid racemase [Mariniphaga sediminis]RIH66505.1 amino acid racemase [Mariniphaga sediminis]
MKSIGIIGGLGPEATVDYYKEIISQINTLNGNGSLNYPEIIVYSVNMATFIGRLEKKDYTGAAGYIVECISKLELAGADFAVISANTPHLFFDEIREKVTIPLISIVEACKTRAKQTGLKRCGLFGTKFTMNASFFSDVFGRDNIEVISPDSDDINRINELLFTELEIGIFKESTQTELLGIVQKMIDKHGIDSLIQGCTEFPIMFTEEKYLGIPFLNTTRIHVDEMVKKSMSS